MLVRLLSFILLLTVIQLGQGMAMFLEIAPVEEAVLPHITLGVLTFLLLLGATYSSRVSGHPAASDITFAAFLYLVQGAFGLTSMMGEATKLAGVIHLYLSFFTVAMVAATVVIAASKTPSTEQRPPATRAVPQPAARI
ncbi:MAG: hypothetical protein NXY59_00830 [Aigarchaeota archaeon]|nr:hypothetical protein [Candidatus Pelearchaeum maunauluense]